MNCFVWYLKVKMGVWQGTPSFCCRDDVAGSGAVPSRGDTNGWNATQREFCGFLSGFEAGVLCGSLLIHDGSQNNST